MDNFNYILRDIFQLFPQASTKTGDIAEKDTPVREKTGFSVQTRMIFISTRNRIMTTTTKTRCKVSAKSWLKAERKAAAKVYHDPNRRAEFFNALHWAEIHRRRMGEYRHAMFCSTRYENTKMCLQFYLYNRNEYKKSIRQSRNWNKPFPLP